MDGVPEPADTQPPSEPPPTIALGGSPSPAELAPDPSATLAPDPAVRAPAPDELEVRSELVDTPRPATAADTLVGTRLGSIAILRLIAEGGMGRVYEGRQEKPRRPVAVKVIKPGLTSPETLKRFEYEAQVLARLRHQGIAQIHTVGTHEVRGQPVPYFVMEYIPNAKPLTRYAHDHKLSTRDRLELFRKVCEAVAHGHQKGVIHRDLKPGNVLVDSSAQPKVIDFGVARTTDSDMALTTMQTDVGAIIGTLQYMSPEQFDADPHDLDVRLDVYALGVILYELLTGKPPYDVSARSIFEVARVVREEEPRPISSLDKTLRRDVAIIAAKCLQKDRNRRYSSATELAGDVARYLAGEPITAVPPTFWDAVARVACKHKAAALAVAGIAASLVAAVVGISAFAIRAERARQAAEQAEAAEHQMRSVAETARQDAEQAAQVAQQERVAADDARKAAERERAAADDARGLAEWQAEQARRALALAERSAEHELGQLAGAIIGQAADPPPLVGGSDLTSRFLDARRVLSAEGRSSFLVDAILPSAFARHPLPLATYRGHRGKVYTAVVSPDGLLAATGSIDGRVLVWNIATGETLATLTGKGRHHGLAFSPSGRQLLTSYGNGLLALWNVPAGDREREWKAHSTLIFEGAFTPDGSRIVTAGSDDEALRVWDEATTEKVLEIDDGCWHLAVAGRSDRVAALSQPPDADARLTIVDLGTGRHAESRLAIPGGVQSVAWSPDDTHLMVGTRDGGVAIVAGDGSRVVGMARGTSRHQIFDIRSAGDGRSVATCGVGKVIETWIWRNESGGPPSLVLERVFRGHEETVVGIDWVPAARRLVSASLDGTARVWAADQPPATTSLRPAADVATGPAADVWLADEVPLAIVRHAESSSFAAALVCYDTRTGRPLATLDLAKLAAQPPADGLLRRLLLGPRNQTPQVSTLAFASGPAAGSVWLIAGGRLHRWSLLDGTIEPLLPVPEAAVVAFCPVANRLAIGTDASCEVWDLEDRRRLAIEPLPSWGVCFSPDGRELVRLDADERLRFHAADTLAAADRDIQLDFGPRFTAASEQVSISWRGDCLLIDAQLWVAPMFVDLRTAAVRRLTAERVTYDDTGLSPDGGWMFGRNADTSEVEIWEVASLERAWSFSASSWAVAADKFCLDSGSGPTVLDLADLEEFLGFQRGVCLGQTFAADRSRPAEELGELGRYYGLCRQSDLAAMLFGAAEARGGGPPAAELAEAFDAAGDGPRAAAAYERAAGGELPAWFCRLRAAAPRKPVAAAANRSRLADFLRLAIDVHESRGDGVEARAAIEQAEKAGVLSATEVAERRAAIEATITKGQTVMAWQDAVDAVGRQVTVEGRVMQTGNIGHICFLNFDADRTFTVPIFEECFSAWPEPPEDWFRGKIIRVSGRISTHKRKPQIEVHDPDRITIVAVAEAPAAVEEAPKIAWQDAAGSVGQQATVIGQVVQTSNIGPICFLNFDKDRTFSVPIFQECFSAWPESPEDRFRNQTVRVTGKITTHKGKPQIEVHDANQIEIVDRAVAPGLAPGRQRALELTPEAAADHLDRVATVTGMIAAVTTEAGECRLRLEAAAGPGFLVRVLPEANPLTLAGRGDPYRPGLSVAVVGRIVRIGDLPGIVVHDGSQLQLRPAAPAPTVLPAESPDARAPQTDPGPTPPPAAL